MVSSHSVGSRSGGEWWKGQAVQTDHYAPRTADRRPTLLLRSVYTATVFGLAGRESSGLNVASMY
jgi:hypothetical protein